MKLEWIEAEQARNKWARECGCRDFVHAMQIGLVAVGKRHPAYLAKHGGVENGFLGEGRNGLPSAAMESGSAGEFDSSGNGNQSECSDRQSAQDELGPPAFPD